MGMKRFFRRDFVGRELIDRDGHLVGKVADTWPTDGGGEPEMLLIKMGQFSLRRYVPIQGVELSDDDRQIRIPWSRLEVDDAPDAEDIRWGDPGAVARAHWMLTSAD
jgi:sporulation protein YlmC with PRC-barrel domain